ncbi:hypothetical protein GCM10009560_69260 [Nonomuraea longicatena]|uniref:Uncharacterized protein n=1 Tax=Nonomuraea longicatena TaxID=83682 RepID=A0ABN1R0L7_9ACTN
MVGDQRGEGKAQEGDPGIGVRAVDPDRHAGLDGVEGGAARRTRSAGVMPPWCFSAVKPTPGLTQCPGDHADGVTRRHKSSFIASDIPGRPIRGTIHPSTSSVALIV